MDNVTCSCGLVYPSFRANTVCKECKRLIPEGQWNGSLKAELEDKDVLIEQLQKDNEELRKLLGG